MYTLSNTNGLILKYSPKLCSFECVLRGKSVEFSKEVPYIKLMAFGKSLKLEFTSANRVHIEEVESTVCSGLRAIYENFYAFGKKLNLTIDTFVNLNNNDDFIGFEISVSCDQNIEIESVVWPQAVKFNDDDPAAYTAIPSLQGALIPSKWHNTFMLYSEGRYFQRDCCMPWWGQYFNGLGYIAIADTPWDGGFRLDHTPRVRTRISNCWYPSLGTMGYRRKHRLMFREGLGYNEMCKTYRDIKIADGSFVSLREKARKNPKLLKCIGAPIIGDYLLVAVDESSPLYESNSLFYMTAEQRAKQLIATKEAGIENAIVHFDGCNSYGYDSGHPDIFPPSDIIGGIEGVKHLIEECHRIGYTFSIHDQYRDYYISSPSFNPQLAIEDSDNNIIKQTINYGGAQSFLCPHNVMPFLKRNYELFEKSGIIADTIHLGAFSGEKIDECFNPLHPITRRECIEKRAEALRYLSSKGYLVSSDEPVDCVINELEMVAQASYSLIPSMSSGISNGVSVPLFNLVYHDALIMPWFYPYEKKGWWGIPNTDASYSHAFLTASPMAIQIPEKKDIQKMLPDLKRLCELCKKLAFTPMVRHEFDEKNPRIQRTYFEDGTVIEVDFNTTRTEIISTP